MDPALKRAIEKGLAEREGVAAERIWLDPGLGFGKHPTLHKLNGSRKSWLQPASVPAVRWRNASGTERSCSMT